MGTGASTAAETGACDGDASPTLQHAAVGYPVFWINLDRCAERRCEMTQAFEAMGISATRIAAVDGKLVDPMTIVDVAAVEAPEDRLHLYPRIGGAESDESDAERVFVNDGSADTKYQSETHERGSATKSEEACTVSHALALFAAVAACAGGRAEAALILEDDVALGLERVAKWPVGLPQIVASLPREWEYLQLYTPNPRIVRGPHGLLSPDPRLGAYEADRGGPRPFAIGRASAKVFGTQAYLVSARGLARLAARHGVAPGRLRLEHWLDVRLVADHWLPSLFPMDQSFVATVPTFVEDADALSTIAPGANSWSHATARDSYLQALDAPAFDYATARAPAAPAPAPKAAPPSPKEACVDADAAAPAPCAAKSAESPKEARRSSHPGALSKGSIQELSISGRDGTVVAVSQRQLTSPAKAPQASPRPASSAKFPPPPLKDAGPMNVKPPTTTPKTPTNKTPLSPKAPLPRSPLSPACTLIVAPEAAATWAGSAAKSARLAHAAVCGGPRSAQKHSPRLAEVPLQAAAQTSSALPKKLPQKSPAR